MGIPSSPSLLLAQDPFGDLLKQLMKQIHQQLEMPDLKQQFGTQMYEQQVVQLSKDGKRGLGEQLVSLSGRSLWGRGFYT